MTLKTRRTFLQTLLLAAPFGTVVVRAQGSPIETVLVAAPDAPESLLVGARFGAEEAHATSSLFGRPFEMRVASAGNPERLTEEAERAAKLGALLITCAIPARIAVAAADAGLRPVSILPREESSEETRILRIRPGADTRERLLARAREKLTAAEGDTARVVAWHHTLHRFGGGELNARFEEKAGRGMDEDAWLGWFALKLALESALRKREAGLSKIDGHKGVPLHFDETGSLRQPLYVVFDRDGKELVIDA